MAGDRPKPIILQSMGSVPVYLALLGLQTATNHNLNQWQQATYGNERQIKINTKCMRGTLKTTRKFLTHVSLQRPVVNNGVVKLTWNKSCTKQTMYVYRNRGAFLQQLLRWKWVKYYIFWVCVCSLNAPYCHVWPVRLYTIFPHYFINGTIFENKSYWT
jgi:hypothetical protein